MASQKAISPPAATSGSSLRLLSSSEEGSNNLDIKGPPQACLFVASISPSTTEESLQQFFSSYGEVVKTKILKDRSSKPYAFVQYKEVEQANEALIATHGQILDGRRLRVEKARVNRTLFIAKIDRGFTNTQVREVCEEFGPVESVTIIRNHFTNQSKGCGFVKYKYREDAMEAFANLKNSPRKLPWVIEWATSTNDPDLQGIDKRNLFIGGLSPRVTKESLEERFGAYGKVESITLVNRDAEILEQNPEEARNAFCFLRYESEDSAIAAIEQENGADWLDRRIRVQYCESPEMKIRRRQVKFYGVQYPSPYGILPNPLMMMGGMYGDVYNYYYGYPGPYGNGGWMPGYGGEYDLSSYEADFNQNTQSGGAELSTENVIQEMASMNLQENGQTTTVAQF
jgi:RNA recognition motif-containing protein